MKVAALFLWLAVPLGLYGVYTHWGTPHLVYEYTFTGGSRSDPRLPRHYLTCRYIGWHGSVIAPAQAGRCPWVRFFHGGSGQ
ncbi:MAG: hypothetical protein AAGE76_01270 [Pseudomonadota bacterium]